MIQNKDLEQLLKYAGTLGLVSQEMAHYLLADPPLQPSICKIKRRVGNKTLSAALSVGYDPERKLFSIQDYKITLLSPPDIKYGPPHKDIQQLENRLAGIDWGQDTKEKTAEARDAYLELSFLATCGDKEVENIADGLILKYWSGTPMMKTVFKEINSEPFEKSIALQLTGGLNDLDVKQSFNLLEGRSVLQYPSVAPVIVHQAAWLKIIDGKLTELPSFDIVTTLKSLPITIPLDKQSGSHLIFRLIKGEPVNQELMVNGKSLLVTLEANPVQGNIAIFDMAGNRLEINNLNNEKRSVHKETSKVPDPTPKIPTKRRKPGKKKGPGL